MCFDNMVKEAILTATLVPASEGLSKLVEGIVATIHAAKDVLIEKKSFMELSTYLERIIPVVEELIRKNIHNSESLNNVAEILVREIKVAQQLTVECSKRNKLYLLVNCRKIFKRLEDTTKEISRALSLIPLATLDLSSGINEEINKLRESMLAAEFKATVAEEEIMAKIESGILERNVDRSYANQLLVQIAEAVGISTERAALKKEFEEFKKEIEDAQVKKNQAEAIQMDQIIALLGRADAMSSPKEKESKYFSKRISLGSQPLEPLEAFTCPITREVMTDPVETSSGQTFERSAIEKWFADGNDTCPLTKSHLNQATLRSNKTLRQSIEEWKERNTMITIASIMKSKITSNEEKEVLLSLDQLRDLCEERDLHREWVVLENYIPLLIELLGSKSRDIRTHALVILCLLVKDSDDNKAKIMEVNNAVESIAKSLARRIGESKLAVALLLELSKCDFVCSHIGNVQGCIFLLVTMLGVSDSQAAKDAKDLLDNLSVHEENVIQMAKANYFKPLLQRLSSGTEDVKMIMTKTLAEMELSDYNKSILFESGVCQPLLHLVSHGDAEMKNVAAKSLQSLSSLPENGVQMIKEGAMGPLLDLLYSWGASAPNLRELAAAIIRNLAISTTICKTNQIEVPLLENDENFRLFSLINLTTPNVQNCILQTFHALCQGPFATDIKLKIRQTAVQVLVLLCEHDNITVRANAVKLFCCLTEDDSDNILAEHVGQTCIGTLLRILKTSNDQEEITATMAIISNLPKGNTQMTQWLLHAGALPIIFKILIDADGLYKNQLIENSVGSLCRFTIPTNQEWQKSAAETGIIPLLVQLVTSGTALTKQRAAISLAQFSTSSMELSRPIEGRAGFWCCSSPRETGCPVHRGICTVESSFCLVEADAVGPLVRVLREPDIGACEASLDALLTLIDGEKLQSGSKVLDDANAIDAIIRLLSCSSINLQEKVLEALERIFRLIEFKQTFGASAQFPLVDITQRGTNAMKSKAARILAQLNVLHDQSSYF